MDDLPNDIIEEFKDTVNRKYGENLSFQDASNILKDLTEYFITLHKIKCRIDKPENSDII